MNIETDKPDWDAARIDAARQQLVRHKAEQKLAWSKVSQLIGIPDGTVSQFAAGTYGGNNQRIAEKVEQYFVGLEAQAELLAIIPKVPGYLDTGFSRRMVGQLTYAQQGDMVAIACAPGMGKTVTAKHYRTIAPNVWIATARPSTSTVQTMQIAVLMAMGEASPKGTPQQLSAQIMARMRNSGGLLIFDEAHELGDQSLEEMRSWHDETGVGIALVGDYRVIARIEGKRDKKDRAQIFSRIGMRQCEQQVKPEDAEILIDAWGIVDPAQRGFMRDVALRPGGLRSMNRMTKVAVTMAAGEPLTLKHLRNARAQLTSTLADD